MSKPNNVTDEPGSGVDPKPIACIQQSCPGHYEHREILHCVERAGGEVICIDHVPALVCDVCGDIQFEAATVRRLQALLELRGRPDRQLPTYEFNRPVPVA